MVDTLTLKCRWHYVTYVAKYTLSKTKHSVMCMPSDRCSTFEYETVILLIHHELLYQSKWISFNTKQLTCCATLILYRLSHIMQWRTLWVTLQVDFSFHYCRNITTLSNHLIIWTALWSSSELTASLWESNIRYQ